MLKRPVLLCMGTRPDIIKMAPLYHEFARRGMDPLILHTGQHEAMAEQMYRFFDMAPDLVLDLGVKRDTLALLSAALLEHIGGALASLAPSAVLVHGDTSSAVMAALAAFYQRIPVGHVEAGLRSHSGYDPFPEEKNREMIARLASWHFAPTAEAVLNLRREGISAHSISEVGNTIVDALHLAQRIAARDGAAISEVLPAELAGLEQTLTPGRRLVLVTAHRRENVEGPLYGIVQAVSDLLARDPDLVVVWPVHANPKVESIVREVFKDLPAEPLARLYLCAPLDYPALILLLGQAWLVLTDSGGIQEEAASLHVPILVMRETTERPELISSGGGMLVGTDRTNIVREVTRMAEDAAIPDAMRAARNPFGDGEAAVRIADVICDELTEGIAA